MIVTEFSRRRKQLAAISFDIPSEEIYTGEELPPKKRFDEQEKLLLDFNTCIDEGVKVGARYSEEGLLELIALCDYNRAKSKALWFLGRRSYASGELYKKLKDEFGSSAAEKAVARMSELGLINDESYAEYMAEQLVKIKNVSARDAVYKITAKGVDRETAQAAVDALEPRAADQLAELIERKYKNALSDEKDIRRTTAALARKGFSYADIRAAMRKYTDEFYED